jgi:Fic family protein
MVVSLTEVDRDKIARAGRAATSALQVHQAMLERPLASAGWLSSKTGLTAATVNKCLAHSERLDIVRELTSRRRNRLFSYVRYIDILNQGMDLPEL